ncbi:MAG: T9SS type A sorting domain-containing protein [Chitinophagaceae bacterium]|nr:MAG: T9SS type A sorting domain-containing protein [Chitinophagaceae bacterium]
MKFNPFPLIAVLLCVSTGALAQQKPDYRIFLNNGTITPLANIDDQELGKFNSRKSTAPLVRLLQFENIPTENQRRQLAQSGIEILEYVSGNAYTVVIRGSLSAAALRQAGVRAMVELLPQQKMQPALALGQLPSRSVIVPGTIDCWISFPAAFTAAQVKAQLVKINVQLLDDVYQNYRILAVRIAAGRLKELASNDYIEYVQAAPKEDEVVNDNSRDNSKVNVLQDPAGRNLDGSGVVIGIGDNADPLQHIDLAERVINRSALQGGAHGIHVMGTAAGAGIIREQQYGMAPAATVLAQAFSNIIALAPVYVQDNHMVITNNSYGNVVNDCATFGIYDLNSRITDQQAFDFPHLQHVFAAGNSGNYTCAGYPAGFSNVLGAYQTAKNVITVGNGGTTYVINNNSSKGPVRDGRIKPEITAQGTTVYSTGPSNSYYYETGTSMSTPAVSGGLALLYQRYRQLHGNADPVNGLMKTLLLNGADDKGNPGPDYKFGFGWMNLSRSVGMLERNDYFSSSVAAGSSQVHTLTIPAGVNISSLKVMLYWNDSAAAVYAAHALVNDLDLEVTGPSGPVVYPQILDTSKANVNNNAVTGPDHINNIEQVVISDPVAGTYTFTVKGTSIPSGGSHGYFLAFDTVAVSAKLTFPIGGERQAGSDNIYVAWDAYGNPSNGFDLQYSTDNGASWNPIQSGIPASSRVNPWVIPNVATTQARVKLTQTGTGLESISDTFTILGVPAINFSSTQCAGYAGLSWTAVANATDYEVMMLKGSKMQPVAVVTTLSYVVSGLNPDSTYYFTVRARLNGKNGRRALAIFRKPDSGSCSGTASDKDLRMDGLVLPSGSGRLFTSTALTSNTVIRVRIRNLDNANTVGNAVMSYRVNGGSWISQTLVNPIIGSNNSKMFSFTSTADFSAVGEYDVDLAVAFAGDPVSSNDTLTVHLRQVDNAVMDLTTDHVDDFEAMPVAEYIGPRFALESADRFDFTTSTAFGRIRSYVNAGLAIGNRALTLDSRTYNGSGTSDSLVATYNLSAYDVDADQVRLDFQYKHHGQFDFPTNRCWVRGSDADEWIEIYDLSANQAEPGIFKKTLSLDLSRALSAEHQQFSSSTQVRWGQFGQYITADDVEAAGYTFDDIHIYKVSNDIQLVSIDSPVVSSCALGNAVPVRITVYNSANAPIASIPVYYQVDGGAVVGSTVPSVAANTSVSFIFPATADLSALGEHRVKVWSALVSDSFHDNDTLEISFHNSPVISTFPYLQDFESSNGDWYPGGNKPSWEYGTPASQGIKRAASGLNAWKTSLAGHYNDGEYSYLYSPCFDLAGMAHPSLSMSIALDLEDCGAGLCDGAYMEYSNDGINWLRLGVNGSGTNWYNRVYDGEGMWSIENYTRWHVATSAVPVSGDMSRVRFRFVMRSDAFVGRDGIAVDDIHVYDSLHSIYTAPPAASAVASVPAVGGSGWFNFLSGGQVIAAVNPQGADLGNTDVQAYINQSAARSKGFQYYHDRNITIKPSDISPSGPVKVRFYFLDTEMEALINATGCATCSKPAMACELGVSKYADADDSRENGTLADDTAGIWTYFNPALVRIVPYDRGYYAEFEVNSFSEFWLNNGGINHTQVLPVELVSFTAVRTKLDKDVKLDWITATEENVLKYVLEMARNNDGFAANRFETVGELPAVGNSNSEQSYTFTDREINKSGVRYYRLKIVDRDGRYSYSSIRPVLFRSNVNWTVYPNPSSGLFNLVYQAAAGKTVQVRVLDLHGRLIREVRTVATGFVQKTELDLSPGRIVPGIYVCEVIAAEDKKSFRLFKR